MNIGLLAADLSLGSSVKEGGSVVVRHREKQQHFLYPLTSGDLHALEVYHKALEDERLKIQAFERELPFCMQLLENAIEASKEQLEERLACKLHTPLHEPQLAAATQEFVCNYTSSLSHRSSMPALGEINLRFKRKWTSMPSSSAHDRPHPYTNTASAFTTKWLLPHNTKLVHNEDGPISIKGSIKLQEFSIPEHALAEEPEKTISQIDGDTKSIGLNCNNDTPTHTMRLHNPKEALYSLVSHHEPIQSDKYMVAKKQDVSVVDLEVHQGCGASAMSVRSINEVACLDVNQSPSTYSRPHSLTNLSPKDVQSGGVQRKPRRCWSPELHQRFLTALNHLGGCQVATPKQIRELMNVEGLTNDEVKSHLQKFRLHMRRPNGVLTNSHGDSQQPGAAGHHLVVFGHIWVPPDYGDQHHQHATNANIEIISSEVSAANAGAMDLMKSFRTSCGNKLNTMDHVQGLNHGQAGPVQGDSNVGLLRLCQEEYCCDEDRMMYESKGLQEIQLLDEGKEKVMERNGSSPIDVDSECCRQQQSANCDVDNHLRSDALCAMKERLPPAGGCVIHDPFAAAVASKKDERGNVHLHAGYHDAGDHGMNEKDKEASPQKTPDYELVSTTSTDQGVAAGGQQLLQLHAADKNPSMNE